MDRVASLIREVSLELAKAIDLETVCLRSSNHDSTLPTVQTVFAKTPKQDRALEAVCHAASNSQRLEVQNLIAPERTLFAFPSFDTDHCEATFGVAVTGRLESSNIESIRASILATLKSTTRRTSQERLEREVAETASVLELVELILEGSNVAEAAYRLAKNLKSIASGSRILIGLRGRRKTMVNLVATSDSESLDPRSPWNRSIERVLNQVLDAREIAVWSRSELIDSENCSEEWKSAIGSDYQSAVAVPILTQDHEPVGAIIFLDAENDSVDDQLTNFLRAAAPSLALALQSVAKRREGQWVTSIVDRTFRANRTWLPLAAVAFLLAAIVLAIPVKHRIDASVRIEPEHRRFVAAPFDGILERAFVKPGDVVKQGDIIAKVDGLSIGWKRAAVLAEQNQARKKRDAAQATRNYAEQQIAQLEIEQQDLELKLLDDRIRHLDIVSPIDGIVTSGDLIRVEGAPIQTGQSLFEIAPLEKLIAELEIQDRRIAFVEAEQTVDFRIDAYPNEKWTGKIASIHPRAELRNNENVFVAEVEIENGDQRLRPGMKGLACIDGASHSYGWILFHEPLEYFVKHWLW